MTTDMKIKNICPVIGMISSGKSTILNTLFNMDYLEASPDVTTKIVTIIRYNSLVTNPKFFKLNLINNGNDNYTFFKENNSEIIGKEKIKEEVKKLNKKLNQKEPKYEDIFYMLEVGQVNFIEKEFLKNNDLADVPGVSENITHKDLDGNEQDAPKPIDSGNDYSMTVEEKMKTFKKEREINYLTQIFRILKNKMNNGIFIFSVNKLQLTENYSIIGKLKEVLGKPIENFLLLLNKMDLSENIESDIRLLNERFLEEFPGGEFNVTRNTIVQCSSFQLENELKMEKEFPYLLYYHYINYIMNSKNFHDFIDYFKNFLQNYLKKEVQNIEKDLFIDNIKSIENDKEIFKQIIEMIKRIKNNHVIIEKKKLMLNENDFDFDNNNNENCTIDKCLDDLVDEDGKIDLIQQTNNVIIILYYYYLYKNKKIKLYRSAETKTILEYFTIQNMNKKFGYKEIEFKLEELNKKDTVNKKIDIVINELNDFYKKYENTGIYLNQIQGVNNSIQPIINNLRTSKFFFIPLLGVYNSGKSTILNDLIGYDLLPVKTGECTKKGILIAHWDYDIPIIRKAKFIVEKRGDQNDISYFEYNNDVIAEGDDNVRKILNGVNGNFIEKEEDFFYIINVKIKFLDSFFFNDNIKEKVCFVDLPGYGTRNRFETKDIYSKFIKSCKIFIMVSVDHFEDKDNVEKINNLMDKTSIYQDISKQALIKKILFVINPNKNLDISEQSLQKKRNALINNIKGLKETVNKDINITFFNGLYYQYYLEKKSYFSNLEYLFRITKKKYLSDLDSFQKGIRRYCPAKFENYILNDLKDNLKATYDINVNRINVEIDKEINNSIDAIINRNHYSFGTNEINDIKKILSYSKNNIEQCKYLNESNYLNFSFYVYFRIMLCKFDSYNELKQLIGNHLDNLNKIFSNEENLKWDLPALEQIEIKNESKEKLIQFNKDIENKIKDINLVKVFHDVPKILENSINTIIKELRGLKDKIENSLKQKKKWKNIQDEFENTFQTLVEKEKNEIITTLENCSQNLNNHYEEAFQIIHKLKINQDKNYQLDELKIYISNKLGEKNNYKEAIDNIVNDIVSESRNATIWKKCSGLIDFIKCKVSDSAYLNRTIDSIISNFQERFSAFRKNISNLIDEYFKEILNKINIEKINLDNILEEQKKKKELENAEKEQQNQEMKEKYRKLKEENEQKKEKWKNICQDYENIKKAINRIFIEESVQEGTEGNEGSVTPTPQ